MKSVSKFFSSLFIAVVMSFLAPVVVCGFILTIGSALGTLPGAMAETLVIGLTDFLKVFGNGDAWQGVLIIAIACSFVGGMFETFNFYYYQNID